MSSEWIQTKDGARVRAYGWKEDECRDEPTVFLAIGFIPLETSFTMRPSDARAIAELLLNAAAYAEQKLAA